MGIENYLEELKAKDGVYSVLSYNEKDQNFINALLKKTFKIVWSHSEIKDKGKPAFIEILFETSQPFYLYVKQKSMDVWSMNIYYKPEKYKELLFFINQLEKK